MKFISLEGLYLILAEPSIETVKKQLGSHTSHSIYADINIDANLASFAFPDHVDFPDEDTMPGKNTTMDDIFIFILSNQHIVRYVALRKAIAPKQELYLGCALMATPYSFLDYVFKHRLQMYIQRVYCNNILANMTNFESLVFRTASSGLFSARNDILRNPNSTCRIRYSYSLWEGWIIPDKKLCPCPPDIGWYHYIDYPSDIESILGDLSQFARKYKSGYWKKKYSQCTKPKSIFINTSVNPYNLLKCAAEDFEILKTIDPIDTILENIWFDPKDFNIFALEVRKKFRYNLNYVHLAGNPNITSETLPRAIDYTTFMEIGKNKLRHDPGYTQKMIREEFCKWDFPSVLKDIIIEYIPIYPRVLPILTI